MEKIGSKAVVGMLKNAMAAAQPMGWVPKIANVFQSSSEFETYPWGNAAGGLKEWVGKRDASGFSKDELTVTNRHFEGSVIVKKSDMRRDKLELIQGMVNDMSVRAAGHPEELITALLQNGETGDCYDGKKFFAENHEDLKSGVQSNLLSVDISALPVQVAGTPTAPSIEEFQLSMVNGISQIIGFKDNAGYHKNNRAAEFLVLVPITMMMTAYQSIDTKTQVSASQTALGELRKRFSIDVEVIPGLTWTDSFAVVRTDSFIKPIVWQRETDYNYANLLDGSDFTTINDAYFYGVDYWGNAAYGMWDQICKVKLI